MTLQKEKKTKASSPSLKAIATVVGEVIGGVYGVVALAPSKTIVDDINVLLKKEDYREGVSVRILRDGSYQITIFCVLAYGVKVSEVIVEVQKNLMYALEKKFKLPFQKVNVFVRNIK